MSSLNQAFIKAYQRRGAAGPHIPLAAPAVTNAAVANAAAEQAVSSVPRPAAVRAFDRKATAPPPSHLFSKAPTAGPLASRYAADDVPPLEPARPLHVVAEKRPLLTVVGESDEAEGQHARSPDADFEPAYEVERFEWPAAVTSLAHEAERELSALIDELLPECRGTLIVTGCCRGEGRTSIALLIARHLARSGTRTLLIDADFRRPNVATCLATDVELGWEETRGQGAPGQAMIESLDDRLVILPLRKALDDAAQPVDDLHLMRGELLRQFDVLCIDAGPLVEGGNDRELNLGETPAAAVVVRDVRRSRMEQSQAVGRKLVQLGIQRWAIIENFV